MSGFGDYFLDQEYQKIVGLGNKLGESRDIIDWEKYRPIISEMYRDNKEIGGRPHHDEILMIKMLILAGWYGLSDYEVELLAIDRLSFRYSWVSGQDTGSVDDMVIQREADKQRKDPSHLGRTPAAT